ncbi:MAG: hypothetical protein WCK77_11445 [Verrucomicrobiota bacterium]
MFKSNLRAVKRHKSQAAGQLCHASYRRVNYVIELDPAVASVPAFAAANPHYIPGMPCLYVGSTSQRPEARYDEHISGSRNPSKIAHTYGRALRMDLVPDQEPIRRQWAIKRESRFARELRASGNGVWQA